MAKPKKKQWSWPTSRTVRTTPQQATKGSTRYRVNKPDGTYEDFYNQADADAFITRMLAEHPDYKAVPLEEGQPSTPTRRPAAKLKQQPAQQQSAPQQPAAPAAQQQGTPQQGTVVQPAQSVGNTGSTGGDSGSGSGSDMRFLVGSSNVPSWVPSFSRWTEENIPWFNRASDTVGKFVNDEIFLNKDNNRVISAQKYPELFKALQEGGNAAAAILGIGTAPVWGPLMVTEGAPFLWDGLKFGFNTLGRAMMPSEWASGLASYSRFAPYAEQLATAGKWGNALVGSYFAGKGLNDIGWGIYNGDSSQVARGGLNLMAATPYGQALRSSKVLMPAVSQIPSQTPTNFLGKIDNFLSSPRTIATGNALTFGGLTAAANNTPRYKPRLDENGNYIYGADGKPELERDEQGNPIMVYPGLFQGISLDNIEDYLIPTIMAIEGVRDGYRQLGNRRPPRKYTVGTGENATVKYTRDLPERPIGERPTYQEALELPPEMVPKVPVKPTPEQFGVRPRQVVPEFNEPMLSDPRNTLRISNVENPRNVIRRRTAGSTPTVEDIEEFKRLQGKRAAEGAALADDVAAYESQQGRIAEHNQRVAQADAEYNSPEQVRAREQYQQAQDAYNSASSNYQATYDEALRNYNQQQRSNFESTIGAEWDSRNSLWQEALASPEYRAWQNSRDREHGVKNWLRNNKWTIGRFGTYGALWLGPKIYRSWRNYNRALDPRLYDGLTPKGITPTDSLPYLPGINVDSLHNTLEDSLRNYMSYPDLSPELVDDEDNN